MVILGVQRCVKKLKGCKLEFRDKMVIIEKTEGKRANLKALRGVLIKLWGVLIG